MLLYRIKAPISLLTFFLTVSHCEGSVCFWMKCVFDENSLSLKLTLVQLTAVLCVEYL